VTASDEAPAESKPSVDVGLEARKQVVVFEPMTVTEPAMQYASVPEKVRTTV
jgi:hypothetical protein